MSKKENIRSTEREWISAREAAKWLGVSHNTVYERCRKNELPHLRIGRNVRLFKQDLVDLGRSVIRQSGSNR